jgi:hypothetical protein
MTPKTAHVYGKTKELRAQALLLLGRAAQARAHAVRIRRDAQLRQLRRRMPEANPLTRAVTAAILDSHGLWEVGPIP